MDAPTKTWQITRGRFTSGATALLDHQTLLYNFSVALTTFAQNPWFVDGSNSNGTFAMDGVNRWSSPTSIVWGLVNSSSISWLALRQPAMSATGNPARLLLGCYYQGADLTTYNGLYVSASLTGVFSTPGTGMANPTGGVAFLTGPTAASFEFGQAWFHGQTSPVGQTISWVAMMTTDGLNTRLLAWVDAPPASASPGVGPLEPVLSGAGRCVMYASFETLEDLVAGVSCPYVFTWQTGNFLSGGALTTYWQGVPLEAFSNVRLATSGRGTCYTRPSGANLSGRWAIEGCASRALANGASRPIGEGAGPNVWDGGVDAYPVRVDANISGVMSNIGRFPDLWTVPELGTQWLGGSAAAPAWCQGPPGLLLPCGGVPFNTGV